jgi:hypothetical protein
MIGNLHGERYYWMIDKNKSVSMIPADVVEKVMEHKMYYDAKEKIEQIEKQLKETVLKTDAELFAERIYFTPEERKAFLRGVDWAKDCVKNESKHIEAIDLRGVIDEYPKGGVYPYCRHCEQFIDARFSIHRKNSLTLQKEGEDNGII